MKRFELVETLQNIARVTLDDEDLVLDEGTTFDSIEDWDSANHLHMVVAMEKEFRIKFGNAELQRLVRVQQLIDIIERRVGERYA